MNKNEKIYIAGHRGLVGTALTHRLLQKGYKNILTRTSSEMDLVCQKSVEDFLVKEKPDWVIMVAAIHGGIQANLSHTAEFLYDNMMINFNLIHAALLAGVKKIINISASCVYPESIFEPFREDMLFSGPVQKGTEGYAWAKAMGIRYCQICNAQFGTKFTSLLPVNLYGRNVSFDPEQTGVLPAMIKRFHDAVKHHKSEVCIWGDGKARREFLHVEDLVSAVELLLNVEHEDDTYNVGSGEWISIQELASICADICGYKGKILNDLTRPKGTSRQKLDSGRLKLLGWEPKVSLRNGIMDLYRYALETNLLE